ncbi:hypothetical protein BDZ91DRAFT_794820 [Kalaharituber pfeilii]|nr:hypothetical protein BDZ91DRAFT_794820 [Kalaharituber pfeilii]
MKGIARGDLTPGGAEEWVRRRWDERMSRGDRDLAILWVKAHRDIAGNTEADTAAKIATALQYQDETVTEAGIRQVAKACRGEERRRLQLTYRPLKYLGTRRRVATLAGIMGDKGLRQWRHQIGKEDSPECRWCGKALENYRHISRECEAWKKRLPGGETGLKMPIGVEKGKGKEEGEKKGMTWYPNPVWGTLREAGLWRGIMWSSVFASLWKRRANRIIPPPKGAILIVRFEEERNMFVSGILPDDPLPRWLEESTCTQTEPVEPTPPPPPPAQPLGLSPITCIDIPPADNTSEQTPPTKKRKGKQPSDKIPYEIKRRLDQNEAKKSANSPPIGTPATPVATTTNKAPDPDIDIDTPNPNTDTELPETDTRPHKKKTQDQQALRPNTKHRRHHIEIWRRRTRNRAEEGLGKGEEVAGVWEQDTGQDRGDKVVETKGRADRGRQEDQLGRGVFGGGERHRQSQVRWEAFEDHSIRAGQAEETLAIARWAAREY